MATLVPLSALRRALKVELEEDDAELVRLEAVAVAHLEDETGYSIALASKSQYAAGFCDVTLPTYPIASVSAVQYRDDAGNLQTLPAENWYLDLAEGPLVVVRFKGSLPTPRRGSVCVQFTAGHAANAIPANVAQAIIALVGLLFANTNAALPVQLSGNPAYEGILATLRCRGQVR